MWHCAGRLRGLLFTHSIIYFLLFHTHASYAASRSFFKPSNYSNTLVLLPWWHVSALHPKRLLPFSALFRATENSPQTNVSAVAAFSISFYFCETPAAVDLFFGHAPRVFDALDRAPCVSGIKTADEYVHHDAERA